MAEMSMIMIINILKVCDYQSYWVTIYSVHAMRSSLLLKIASQTVESSLPNFSSRVQKLLLQLHLTINLPSTTVEPRFTAVLGQAKSPPVAMLCLSFPCVLNHILLYLLHVYSNYTKISYFQSVNQN